jgi:magnesium-protoporphyrin O-methyltransferase
MQGLIRAGLPADLGGARVLDAGCGTGTFSVALARAGARVVAVDLSPTLVGLASERAKAAGIDDLEFRVGDMLASELGTFDFVVAMDSLIHYAEDDMVDMVAGLTARARHKLIFTFAPKTLPLSLMHLAGKFFPRGDRAPAIEPISEARLRRRVGEDPRLEGWRAGRAEEVSSGFYTSRLLEIER